MPSLSSIRHKVGHRLLRLLIGQDAAKRVAAASTAIPEAASIYIPRVALGGGAAFGEEFDDEQILYAIKREPVAYKAVFHVAHDMFDKWFEVGDAKKEGKDEKLDVTVQNELTTIKAKPVFAQAAVYERAFGWSIILIGYEDAGETLADEVKNAESIKDLAAYSPRQIGKRGLELDKDPDSTRYGWPVIYPVKRLAKENYTPVHHTRVIHFATRIVEPGYKGLPVVSPMWDDMTTCRNIRWGMGQTIYRYGSGFPVVSVEGADKDELDELANRWGPLTARTSLFKNEKQEIEFKGLGGRALDPEHYYVPIMENLSTSSGIPMAILRGVQAGALTGSEVNEREYFKLVSDAQMTFEPGVRFLIDKLIEIKQVKTTVKAGEYEVDWVGAFEINPRDKAAALLDESRAYALQTEYKTVNEIRQQQDLTDIAGGNVVLGLVRAETALLKARDQGNQNQNNRERSRRKAAIEKKFGKPVKYLLQERINRRDSVHKICKELGIAKDTYYRWVQEYGIY